MKTDESKALYRGRKVLAERPNAILKHEFGLRRMPVRSQDRVETVGWMVALMITMREFRNHWLN